MKLIKRYALTWKKIQGLCEKKKPLGDGVFQCMKDDLLQCLCNEGRCPIVKTAPKVYGNKNNEGKT